MLHDALIYLHDCFDFDTPTLKSYGLKLPLAKLVLRFWSEFWQYKENPEICRYAFYLCSLNCIVVNSRYRWHYTTRCLYYRARPPGGSMVSHVVGRERIIIDRLPTSGLERAVQQNSNTDLLNCRNYSQVQMQTKKFTSLRHILIKGYLC